MTGGLVAAHADGRDRHSIWAALERREVYGTTGPRILLWFELLNPPASSALDAAPMGSVVELTGAPVFRARAVGSFEQLPGCPEESASALGAQELERICRGECYRPSDLRRRITRIEVVRIRPQQSPDEPMAKLIDDPWKVFPCEPDPAGCTVTFSDPDFVASTRAALYYVRARSAGRLPRAARATRLVLADPGRPPIPAERPCAQRLAPAAAPGLPRRAQPLARASLTPLSARV